MPCSFNFLNPRWPLTLFFCRKRGDESQSVFRKWFPGSTGDPPVPSGDSPDGTGTTIRGNEDGLFETWITAVPVGGSPTEAGESPALPIFKTRSQTSSVSGGQVRES